MNVHIKFLICTIFLYNCGTCFGVQQCWFCDSHECNDPFNSSVAIKQNCSYLPQNYDHTNNKAINFDKLKHAVLMPTNLTSNGSNNTEKSYKVTKGTKVQSYFCTKYTGNDGGITITFRGCALQTTTTNSKDFCQNLNHITEKDRENYLLDCSTCDSDLCNSAIGWKSSLSVTVAAILTLLSFFAINN